MSDLPRRVAHRRVHHPGVGDRPAPRAPPDPRRARGPRRAAGPFGRRDGWAPPASLPPTVTAVPTALKAQERVGDFALSRRRVNRPRLKCLSRRELSVGADITFIRQPPALSGGSAPFIVFDDCRPRAWGLRSPLAFCPRSAPRPWWRRCDHATSTRLRARHVLDARRSKGREDRAQSGREGR